MLPVLPSNTSGAPVRLTPWKLAEKQVEKITNPADRLPHWESKLAQLDAELANPNTGGDRVEVLLQEVIPRVTWVIHLLKQAIALQAPTAAVKAAFDALKAEDATIAGLQAQLQQAQARRVTLATAATQTSKELADKKAVWEATNPLPE